MNRRDFLIATPLVLAPSVPLLAKPAHPTARFDESGKLLNVDEIFHGIPFVKYDEEARKEWNHGHCNEGYVRHAKVYVEEKDAFGGEVRYWGLCRATQLLDRIHYKGEVPDDPVVFCRCVINPQPGCYSKASPSGWVGLPDDLVKQYWSEAKHAS